MDHKKYPVSNRLGWTTRDINESLRDMGLNAWESFKNPVGETRKYYRDEGWEDIEVGSRCEASIGQELYQEDWSQYDINYVWNDKGWRYTEPKQKSVAAFIGCNLVTGPCCKLEHTLPYELSRLNDWEYVAFGEVPADDWYSTLVDMSEHYDYHTIFLVDTHRLSRMQLYHRLFIDQVTKTQHSVMHWMLMSHHLDMYRSLDIMLQQKFPKAKIYHVCLRELGWQIGRSKIREDFVLNNIEYNNITKLDVYGKDFILDVGRNGTNLGPKTFVELSRVINRSIKE